MDFYSFNMRAYVCFVFFINYLFTYDSIFLGCHLSDLLNFERESLVNSIIDCLFSLRLIDAPIMTSSKVVPESNSSIVTLNSFKSTIPSDIAKKNVLLICNCFRILGQCAVMLQGDFDSILSRVLCCTLEKAGDSNVMVSTYAVLALGQMSKAMKFESIPKLIENSVPFFWFPLSQKLKRLTDFPSSPQILRVVLKYCGGEVKIFVQELIEDVLDSLDAFHSDCALPLLIVILSFVETIDSVDRALLHTSAKQKSNSIISLGEETGAILYYLQKIDKECADLEKELDDQSTNDNFDSAKEGFRNYFRETEEASCMVERNIDLPQEEGKDEVPNTITLFVQILEKCSYLLFVKDRKVQLTIFSIILNCCRVLEQWENQKLPCYHKIWKPLVLRLKDQDFVVFLKSLEICLLMIKTSGDFLKPRFVKELLPPLLSFLESQSSSNITDRKSNGKYNLTPNYKAQKGILSTLPELFDILQLDVPEANDILDAIIPYLDENKAVEFNRLALKVVKIIATYHPNLVWLTLSSCRGFVRIDVPSSSPLTSVQVSVRSLQIITPCL